MSTSVGQPSDAAQRTIAILQSATKPIALGQLKKATRLDDAALADVLETTIKQGAVFRWPEYRRVQYFWSQSPNEAARSTVLALTAEEAYSQSNLANKACKKVPGFSRKEMLTIIHELTSTRELQQVPAFSSGKLFIRTGTASAYEASARKFVAEKFRKAGFHDGPSFLALVSTPVQTVTEGQDVATRILESIRSLEKASGVPVSAHALRDHLKGISKRDFDQAAIQLRDAEQIALSLHHDPYSLTEPERDLLVDGRDGRYYVALGFR